MGWPGEVRRRLLAAPALAALAVRLDAVSVQVTLTWLLDLTGGVLAHPADLHPRPTRREPRGGWAVDRASWGADALERPRADHLGMSER